MPVARCYPVAVAKGRICLPSLYYCFQEGAKILGVVHLNQQGLVGKQLFVSVAPDIDAFGANVDKFRIVPVGYVIVDKCAWQLLGDRR